jgi:hypothetical protein
MGRELDKACQDKDCQDNLHPRYATDTSLFCLHVQTMGLMGLNWPCISFLVCWRGQTYALSILNMTK